MRFFYDCEFIEDGVTIDLVSIGVVDEEGREFYAVSTEFDPERAGPWVRQNVLNQLPSPADKAWRMALAVAGGAAVYFAALGLAGLRPRHLKSL